MQQALEETIHQFEQWQAERGAARMRIAALMRYGMAKNRTDEHIGTPQPTGRTTTLQASR